MKICEKCNADFSEVNAEKYKTYEGIDEHHNPPEFMFEKGEKWNGRFIKLCRKCHTELHKEIREIMFKHSNLFKPKNSDHWIWIAVLPINRIKCREEVKEFTERWLEND